METKRGTGRRKERKEKGDKREKKRREEKRKEKKGTERKEKKSKERESEERRGRGRGRREEGRGQRRGKERGGEGRRRKKERTRERGEEGQRAEGQKGTRRGEPQDKSREPVRSRSQCITQRHNYKHKKTSLLLLYQNLYARKKRTKPKHVHSCSDSKCKTFGRSRFQSHSRRSSEVKNTSSTSTVLQAKMNGKQDK